MVQLNITTSRQTDRPRQTVTDLQIALVSSRFAPTLIAKDTDYACYSFLFHSALKRMGLSLTCQWLLSDWRRGSEFGNCVLAGSPICVLKDAVHKRFMLCTLKSNTLDMALVCSLIIMHWWFMVGCQCQGESSELSHNDFCCLEKAFTQHGTYQYTTIRCQALHLTPEHCPSPLVDNNCLDLTLIRSISGFCFEWYLLHFDMLSFQEYRCHFRPG